MNERKIRDLLYNQTQFTIASRLLNDIPRGDLTPGEQQMRDYLGELQEEAEEYLKQNTLPDDLRDESQEISNSVINWYNSLHINIDELKNTDEEQQSRHRDLLDLINEKRRYLPSFMQRTVDIQIESLPSEDQDIIKQNSTIPNEYYLSENNIIQQYNKVRENINEISYLRNTHANSEEEAGQINNRISSLNEEIRNFAERNSLSPLSNEIERLRRQATSDEAEITEVQDNEEEQITQEENNNQLVFYRRATQIAERYRETRSETDRNILSEYNNRLSDTIELGLLQNQDITQLTEEQLENRNTRINELSENLQNTANSLLTEDLQDEINQLQPYVLNVMNSVSNHVNKYKSIKNDPDQQYELGELEFLINDDFRLFDGMSNSQTMYQLGTMLNEYTLNLLGEDKDIYKFTSFPKADNYEELLLAYSDTLDDLTELNSLDKTNSENIEKVKTLENKIKDQIKSISKAELFEIEAELNNNLEKASNNYDNNEQINNNILDPNFNPYLINPDDYQKMFRTESKKYTEGSDNFNKIVQTYSKVRQNRRHEKKSNNFLKDVNDNVMYYPGTSIPQPRLQNWDETTEDYNKWLYDVFAKELENGNYFGDKFVIENKNNDAKRLENKHNVNTPLLENKYNKDPLLLENKYNLDKKKKSPRTLQQIMYELQHGLKIEAKSGKKLIASEVKVSNEFYKAVHQGNAIYNVFAVVPSVIKSVVMSANKLRSKWWLYRHDQEDQVKELRNRINNLSQDDIEIIWNEYRGTEVIQDNFTFALNSLLNDRIQRYADEKVQGINTEIIKDYNKIFGDYEVLKSIDKSLNDNNLTEKQHQDLEERRQALINGKAELVEKIRNLYIEGNQYYSGGAHGFSEDMKAAATGLSQIGKRFIKRHGYNDELQEKIAKLTTDEKKAIIEKDDLAAFKSFVEYEQLKAKETNVKKSFLGRKSVGEKYYLPTVGKVNYNDDPLIKNIFKTIAGITSLVSTINALKTHLNDVDNMSDEIERVNAHNKDTINQVHDIGNKISGKRQTFESGIQAQAHSDIINKQNTNERMAYDADAISTGGSHGGYGSEYRTIDVQGHNDVEQLYDSVKEQISDATSKYAQGLIDRPGLTESISNIATQANQSLKGTIEQALPYFEQYAASHPQFKLSGVGESMRYIVDNPTAIPDMYQAMVDTTNLGDTLSGLSIEQIQAFQSLPSDLATTLIANASALGLAYNCSKCTQNSTMRGRSEQDQQIMDMVLDSAKTENNNQQTSSRAK